MKDRSAGRAGRRKGRKFEWYSRKDRGRVVREE
jgi:hypothetical protein